jgi:small subunit ribosomal protein S8
MINDTISDMLTRIRNANLIKNENVFVLNTKTNKRIGELLKKQGYIESIKISSNNFTLISIKLKYNSNSKKPCITNLKRLSSPGLRIYSSYKKIPRIFNGMGTVIISTSKGLMTDNEARMNKIGGEILFSIW